MKDFNLNGQDDPSKRVPITFRVPVQKKKELLECAEKRGASLTDILEVLTEDPEDKLTMFDSAFFLDDEKFNQILECLDIKLEDAQEQVIKLTEELSVQSAENVELIKARWIYRKFLGHFQNTGELLKFKTDVDSIKRNLDKLE